MQVERQKSTRGEGERTEEEEEEALMDLEKLQVTRGLVAGE